MADLIGRAPNRPDASTRSAGGPALDNATEHSLVRVAVQIGAKHFGGHLSQAESALIRASSEEPDFDRSHIDRIVSAIRHGADPLGESFLRLRSGRERRNLGAFYTPAQIVRPMVDWVLSKRPQRVVDAGSGSGRFSTALVRSSRRVAVIAVDIDPLATILTRAALAAVNASNAVVLNIDYTRHDLPCIDGATAFIGNPPYVRHHALTSSAKEWIVSISEDLGHRASALAGLHAHFFVATAMNARVGDFGCFVTSSEWLDVGYGSIVRHLLTNGLGGRAIHLIRPTATPFEDAQTTAVITCFEKGASYPTIAVRVVDDASELSDLNLGEPVLASKFAQASRWTDLVVHAGRSSAAPFVTLGQTFRVSRGLVTGANDFFVMTREQAAKRGLKAWCRPAITEANEIFQSDGAVRDVAELKVVLALPRDFDRKSHPSVDRYLAEGERTLDGQAAISHHYICSHRRPWWYLGSQRPPPIVSTYMARQAPKFARNPDNLIILNIAHCLYPKGPLTDQQAEERVASLNRSRSQFRGRGRTYQGGLEKFEPREMEALPVASN